eukprot:gene9818-18390_t
MTEENEPKKGGIRKSRRPSKNAVPRRHRMRHFSLEDEAISDDSTDSNDSQSDSKETNNGKEVREIQKEQKGQESTAKNRGNTEESQPSQIVSGKGYKFEENSAAHSRFSTIRRHDFYGC